MAALPLIVFDVNATLLDLTIMEPTFERIFRDKGSFDRKGTLNRKGTLKRSYLLNTSSLEDVLKINADR
jgi:hypothetical protein